MRGYLLVGDEGVSLQGAQMSVDECSGTVVFTEQTAIDVVETVAWQQPVPTGGAGEALWGVEGGG